MYLFDLCEQADDALDDAFEHFFELRLELHLSLLVLLDDVDYTLHEGDVIEHVWHLILLSMLQIVYYPEKGYMLYVHWKE